MMAIVLLLALASGALAAPVEVGARFGIASFVGSEHTDGTRAAISIPGASSLYAMWFPSQKISFGPKFSFHYTSGDFGYWSSYIGALAGYYPRGHTRSGLFTEAELGRSFLQDSDGQLVIGAGLGYLSQSPVFVRRAQVQYRRWNDGGGSDLSVLFALGVRR